MTTEAPPPLPCEGDGLVVTDPLVGLRDEGGRRLFVCPLCGRALNPVGGCPPRHDDGRG